MMSIISLITLCNDIRWGGYIIGMDSYYSSIPVMLQLSYWGIRAIGTVNASRKGLGKFFQDLKKLLKKDYSKNKGRKNTKKGGFEKGYYKYRTVDDEPLAVVVQKDSKAMVYITNCISPTEKSIVLRYDKVQKKVQEVSFWLGHKIFNFLYGMSDQATSWRSKGGGHKAKSTK